MTVTSASRPVFGRGAAPLAVGLLLSAAFACEGEREASTDTPQEAAQASRPTPEEAARLDSIYRARADSALAEHHPEDAAFMTGMIAHHAQALVMSGFAPENGASEPIQILTARIINGQQDEIHVMQSWLRARGYEVPEVHIEGHQLMIHGPGHGHMMPGMLTQEELSELGRAQGPDYDRLFLRYMIRHHEGAVEMVRDLFSVGGAAQDDFVFKLASDIQADQSSEIKRMRLMLDEMS